MGCTTQLGEKGVLRCVSLEEIEKVPKAPSEKFEASREGVNLSSEGVLYS
jgi:hypothetical protein